jgi:hypothetical protein
MLTLKTAQKQWIEKLITWANTRTEVRAALVIGSQGREGILPSEPWSDIDVMLLVAQETPSFTERHAWMGEIDRLWAGVLDLDETFGGWVPVYCGFSVYAGGVNVDFMLLPQRKVRWATQVMRFLERFPRLRQVLPESIANLGIDAGDLLRHGAKILIDKDGIAGQFQRAIISSPVEPPAPPSQSKFEATVESFWVDPTRIASDLLRGRLAEAMKALHNLQKRLLRMVEWHARSKNSWQGDDLVYRLKSIDQWADPRTLQALPLTCPHYNADEMWQALIQAIELYHWLSMETAEALGYACSFETGEQVKAWVEKCHAENCS